MTSQREFDLSTNDALFYEALRVYNDSKLGGEKLNLEIEVEYPPNDGMIKYVHVTTIDGDKVDVFYPELQKLLNERTQVKYSQHDNPNDNLNEPWIAAWYPLNKLEQIQTANFNSMLTNAIKQNSETKNKKYEPFYSGYDPEKPPMQVVHHPYKKGDSDDTQYVDIEITFNIPNIQVDGSGYHENQIIIRFIENFRYLMTQEDFNAEKLETLTNSILEFKCSAMRSAMTQEGGTCFINAVFNVIRLSPDFSNLIQKKTLTANSDRDYLPEKCDPTDSTNPTDPNDPNDPKACKDDRMVHMADVRNKRRHIGNNICKLDSGYPVPVMEDICKTYGISLTIDPPTAAPLFEDVLISTNVVYDDLYNKGKYKLIGSVIQSGAHSGISHIVCGYFCATTARVFDSYGYDIAYDWAPSAAGFDINVIGKGVFDGLSAQTKKIDDKMIKPFKFEAYAVGTPNIHLVYINSSHSLS